jgi:hypothetical protein
MDGLQKGEQAPPIRTLQRAGELAQQAAARGVVAEAVADADSPGRHFLQGTQPGRGLETAAIRIQCFTASNALTTLGPFPLPLKQLQAFVLRLSYKYIAIFSEPDTCVSSFESPSSVENASCAASSRGSSAGWRCV